MNTVPLRNAARFFDEKPTWVVLAAGVALLALVCYVDWVTGPDIPFALFYLLPVSFVTWNRGRNWGTVTALLSAVASMGADLAGAAKYSRPVFAYLNATSRFGFFWMVVMLLSAWKQAGRRLEATVEERTAALKAEIQEHAAARQALQKLGAQLAAAEDAQRRRLAYDIHDALGQMLSLLKLNLETILDDGDTSAVAKDSQPRRLAEAVGIVDNLIHQTRTLILDLHPAMLDDLGLVPTLHWYAGQFGRQTGAEITVSEQGVSRPLPPATSHYLFRAVKELLNNALKHGRAREIIVALHWQSEVVRIVVDDDGSGFDPAITMAPQARRGLGLAGIRERLTSLGGSLHIESRHTEGARIMLEAPLEPSLPLAAADAQAVQ